MWAEEFTEHNPLWVTFLIRKPLCWKWKKYQPWLLNEVCCRGRSARVLLGYNSNSTELNLSGFKNSSYSSTSTSTLSNNCCSHICRGESKKEQALGVIRLGRRVHFDNQPLLFLCDSIIAHISPLEKNETCSLLYYRREQLVFQVVS